MDVFAIRFRPWGVSRFSSHSMADFLDKEVLPDDVFGALGITLRNEISKAADDRSRVEVVNALLNRALDERNVRNDKLNKLIEAVNSGRSKGHEIAHALGISERSFRRFWHDVVGIEQRKFATLMRFHRAVSMIDAAHKLATVAAECGYSDQSHLARDIKAISGIPSTSLRRRLGADVYQALYTDRPSPPWLPSH